MQLSSKILKTPGKTGGCIILELRHDFFNKDEETAFPDEHPEEGAARVDPDQLAAQVIAGAETKARQIIAEAEAKAAEIEKQAAQSMMDNLADAERIKKEARNEGLAEGKKEAMAKAAADAEALREEARSVLRQAEEIRRRTIESMEGEIVGLAVEIAEKVLSAKLRLDPEVIVEAGREAISLLHDRDRVVVYVNPAQVDIFEETRDELVRLLSPKGELFIIADYSVGPGGCIAETEHGRVDARLNVRWQALLKTLEEVAT